MSDLRYDPISALWVAIARRRRERPIEFIPIEQIHQQIICPFCSGNEDETPPAIAAYRENGEQLEAGDDPASWMSRVVSNKYPSLSDARGTHPKGPYDCSVRDGVQELIIPTPRHLTSISELTPRELDLCLLACQHRVAALREQPDLEHVMLFMNCRSSAGASLEHIHFQVMASPLVSHYLKDRTARNDHHVQSHGESLLTALTKWELEQSVRIVRETENFVMYCPYASRFSFQVWIVPRDPELEFETVTKKVRQELAELCRQYVSKLEQILESPAYNLLVNLAPNKHRENEHWFVEIFPRLNRMAGYEIGTDVWVNPVPPETATKRLRTDQ